MFNRSELDESGIDSYIHAPYGWAKKEILFMAKYLENAMPEKVLLLQNVVLNFCSFVLPGYLRYSPF